MRKYTAPQKYSVTPIFLDFNIITARFIFKLSCNNKNRVKIKF